ncbi:MAG: PorP/SprF family type IX secretion system membrane protein [Flavisolibacter sp.]
MKRKIVLIVITFSILKSSSAQDINFSQFYELPLLRNPALAGIYRGDVRVTTAFRNQWNSVTVPYKTQALGTELKFGISQNSYDFLSLGLQITNDVAGDSKMGKTQILPLLAYHKSVSSERDAYITLGFLGGVVQQRFDPSNLKFDDQFVGGAYSPTNPTRQTFTNTNVRYLDAAAGIKYSSVMGYDTKYYIGGAYFHFTEPKVAFAQTNDIRLNKKFVFNAGLSAATSETDRVIFYLDYFMQGGNNQAQGGVLYKHDIIQEDDDETFSLSGGAFLRWNDAVIPVIKLDYYNWAVGLTYDVNISKLRTASQSRGGFELTLSYSNFLNIRNSSAEKVRCPVDFN